MCGKITFNEAVAEKNLKKALACYFDGREEWQEVLISPDLHYQAKRHAIEKRAKEKERNPRTLMALPFRIEDTALKTELSSSLLACAEHLYPEKIQIRDIHVMMNCRTKPLRCSIAIGANEKIHEQFYAKACNVHNDPRALGIELMKLVSPIRRDYHYQFDGNMILEQHIMGEHIVRYDETFLRSSRHVAGAVEFLVTALYIGLTDLKYDNYVVRPNGVHIPIDFDLMCPFTVDGIANLHEEKQKELGLSTTSYKEIVGRVRKKVKKHADYQKEEITQIATLYSLMEDYYESLCNYLQNEDIKAKIFME